MILPDQPMPPFLEVTGQVRTFVFLSRLAMLFALGPIFIAGEGIQRSLVVLGGTVLGLTCLAAICLTIRCPACGAYVLWHGVRTVRLPRCPEWVSTFDRCPSCHLGGDELLERGADAE